MISQVLNKKDWDKAHGDLEVLEKGNRNLVLDGYIERGKDLGMAQAEHLYYADIYSVLDENLGREITISFDIQARVGHYLQVYCSNKTDDRSFNPKTFRNFGTERQRLSFTTLAIEGGRGITKREAWIEFYGEYETGNIFKISNVKIELGSTASPYTPAPQDINAHPFVAELAETSYLNKVNRKEINELSNAVTSLGGSINV